MIGPDSAIILALGWMTVLAPMVMSPFSSDSLQTTAPVEIFTLPLLSLDIVSSFTVCL